MKVRTQLTVLACVLFLIGAWDFARRVYVGRDPSLRVFKAPPVLPLAKSETADDVGRRIAGWLPTIAGSVASGADPADPKSWRFTLQGIFVHKGKVTAVMTASLQTHLPAEKVRVTAGDSVHGWQVDAIGPHTVTLKHDAETQQLLLFRRGGRGPVGVAVSRR
jgi:hypothetical protein